MKNIKKSLIMNIIIALLVLIGCIFMFTGYRFMTNTVLLDYDNITMFQYFTVDSNILVGIASLILIVYELLLINKKIKEIPSIIYLIKGSGVVSVTLTFLVTLFFLAPSSRYGFLSLYMNTNLFFHLIVPILSIISFVFYEKFDNNKLNPFYGTIPMILYSIFYIINILLHTNGSTVSYEYDFYGFLGGNIYNSIIVLPIIFIITYIISYIILKLNKKRLNY